MNKKDYIPPIYILIFAFIIVIISGYWFTVPFFSFGKILHINLDKLSQVAQIAIALLAFISIFVSARLTRKTLKKSDQNAALLSAPSIIIGAHQFLIFRNDGIYIKKDEIVQKDSEKPERNVGRFHIWFKCENLGKGVALNIKKPRIIGEFALVKYESTPFFLTTKNDDQFYFEVYIEKTLDEWYQISTEDGIPVRVEINYTNDQQNINCLSWWFAKINPFDIDGENLKARHLKILERNGGVSYFPLN